MVIYIDVLVLLTKNQNVRIWSDKYRLVVGYTGFLCRRRMARKGTYEIVIPYL